MGPPPGSPAPGSPQEFLTKAFGAFIAAAGRLEASYRDLKAEVAGLSFALSARDQALAESRSETDSITQVLRQLVNAVPYGVLVTARDGTVRFANGEAARLLNLSAAQMPNLQAIVAHTGLSIFSIQDSFTGEDRAEQELLAKGSGNRPDLVVRRLHTAGGWARSQVGLDAVYTIQHAPSPRSSERNTDAGDLAALAQVSALLAHEIRNPLATLELFAGSIADSPERREEWLSHLRAGIRSLSGTVNNVLTLHGEGSPEREAVDLGAEAAIAVRFLQPLAQQTSVALSLDKPEASLWVRANRCAVQQVLLNLCSNALRHTSASGQVRVRCESDPHRPEQLLVSVADNGGGIAPEHLPFLFDGGFSGSGTRPGLGLAVCKRLMEHHGGSIHVESRVGSGSTFTLEFQRA